MFKEENITGRTDLQTNQSLSSYLGHTTQQNPHAYEVFYKFLETVKPKRILEIGTAFGGFTIFLRLICNDLDLSTKIRSYETHDGYKHYDTIRAMDIDIRIEDIFQPVYTAVKQEAVDFIQEEGVTVVLCDGGHKIHEYNLLTPFIKTGDFILAHDYASNREYFEQNINMKFWNWHEIQDSDIEEVSNVNNLEPFMQDDFTKAVWVCKVKK
jgi:cephalosporin hydroxylase